MITINGIRDHNPRKQRSRSAEYAAKSVESGDVLVIDPDVPGRMRLATEAADGGVFGIVAAEAGVVLGVEAVPPAENDESSLDVEANEGAPGSLRVPVAISGVAVCKVDAGYGGIRPGDLLTTSPTPGHAMLADPDPLPGTILGKALEPLDTGTGLIKLLVMLR